LVDSRLGGPCMTEIEVVEARERHALVRFVLRRYRDGTPRDEETVRIPLPEGWKDADLAKLIDRAARNLEDWIARRDAQRDARLGPKKPVEGMGYDAKKRKFVP